MIKKKKKIHGFHLTRKRQGCPLSLLPFNLLITVIGKKKMVSHCDWKQRCKMFLFANTMIVYVENPESEVAQWCPTLCDPMDCSPLGSSVHGIFQARTLEWVSISFSR